MSSSSATPHDYTSANKAHFDEVAGTATIYPPGYEGLAEKTLAAALKLYPFKKESTRVLDFACGTGILAGYFAPHVKSIIGLDISQGMINEFNKNVASNKWENMKAYVADILAEDQELPEDVRDQKFDVILCALAYHHFADLNTVTRALAGYLTPKGALIISEYTSEPELDFAMEKAPDHIVAHSDLKVFQEEAMRKLLTSNGLVDVAFSERLEVNLFDLDYTVMLSKGVKA